VAALDSASARTQSEAGLAGGEEIGEAPPADPCGVLEVTVEAGIGIGPAGHDFVDGFVAAVAAGDRVLRAFLEIDHERYGEPRPIQPADIGQAIGITTQISHRCLTPS